MELGRFLKLVVIAVAVVLPIRTWVAEPVYVASPSMEPTLKTGTLMILDKLTLCVRSLQRGDVLAFRSPVGEHDLIKRVVALPGETVEMREKAIFINGKELNEPYAVHSRAGERLEGDNIGPLIVPENSFFVLGDNRDESNDSSVWKDAQGKPVHFLRLKFIQGIVRRLPWA